MLLIPLADLRGGELWSAHVASGGNAHGKLGGKPRMFL